MKNEPKTDVLLHMMEQPERYTEEQWRDILSDSECRELYTLMAMTQGCLDADKADAELTDEEIEREWEKVKDPPPALPIREGVVTFENESTLPSTHSTPSLTGRVRGGSALHRIAAIFIAVAFLGGIALAAYRVLSHRQTPPTDVSILNPQPSTLNSEADSLVRFADLRLDSILAVVGSHYGRAVCFRDTQACGLRLHTTWNRTQPLDSFVVTLNEFEVLKLTDEHDTLFVESVAEEVLR